MCPVLLENAERVFGETCRSYFVTYCPPCLRFAIVALNRYGAFLRLSAFRLTSPQTCQAAAHQYSTNDFPEDHYYSKLDLARRKWVGVCIRFGWAKEPKWTLIPFEAIGICRSSTVVVHFELFTCFLAIAPS
jgi:hypothetical protein